MDCWNLFEYPINLVASICESYDPQEDSVPDLDGSVEYVLGTLYYEEEELLTKHYKSRVPCNEIAEDYGISTGEVKSMMEKVLNKIRKSERYDIIRYGVIGYVSRRVQTAYDDGAKYLDSHSKNFSAQEIGLSMTTTKMLNSHGLRTISEICAIKKSDLDNKIASRVEKKLKVLGLRLKKPYLS